ncbi:MAG: replication initiation factor domain-containing protein [Planctomycetota bacterium]
MDWLRVSFKAGECHLPRLRALLTKYCGESEEAPGLWSYREGRLYATGARLVWAQRSEDPGDPDASCCLELSATALKALPESERLPFMRSVSLGGKFTRVDLALDFFHEENVGLITAVLEACQAGKLCQFRLWNPQLKYDMTTRKGYGVTLGSTKSERSVCLYDKGLETESKPMGEWERLEMRWEGDAAQLVGQSVLGADDFERSAFEHVIGGMSFRELGGANDRHLSRREVVAFWRDVCAGGVPRRAVPQRAPRSLARSAAWLASCVVPTFQALGDSVGRSYLEVMDYLIGDRAVPAKASGVRILVADLRKSVEARPFATVF